MPDKTIKHFVIIRFFPRQDPKYPYDIFDVDFLSKQLILANNALRSLENQTNKNFELVFVLHKKFFTDKKYEFIFATLKDIATVPVTFIHFVPGAKTRWLKSKMSLLVKDALNKYDFVIQSRMDFDDFIYKDAIADAQNKVNECDNVLVYGYNKGYEYMYGELYPYYNTFHEIGHLAILQSVILKSSFAKNLPFISVFGNNFTHHDIKSKLKELLEQNGVMFSENMFQQNTTINAFIYFRSEWSREHTTHHGNNSQLKLPKNRKIIVADITKKQLEEEFGFFHELNSIK